MFRTGNTIAKYAVLGFAGLALAAAGILFAQPNHPRGFGGGGFGPGFGGPGPMKELLAGYLDLTDAQKQQGQAIFEAARQQAQPVVDQLKAGHDTMAAAVKAGKSDAELQKIADTQGVLMGQVAGIHAKAFAKFWAILTPDQQAKADKLHSQMKERFVHHAPAPAQ